MKVLLINPGRYDCDKDILNEVMKIRLKAPLLGLPYLAAVTPEHINIKIIDEENEEINDFEKADLVGIGGMTMHTKRRYEIADIYRNMNIPVVLGGIHVSSMPEESMKHADSIVIGEAEEIWPRLLDDFEKGNLKPIYKAENKFSIENLPHPKRNLMAGPAYTYPNGTLNSIMTTRGCPNNCHFCSVTEMFGRRFRTRLINDVIEEFSKMNPGYTLFCDDNIVGNINYSKELFKAMRPLRKKWIAQSSFLIAEKDGLLKLAKDAGCYMLFIGIDSLSEDNIINMNKNNVNKIEKYSENIKKIQDAGIKVFGSIIVGFDHDDESVFDNVYEFVIKNKIDKVSLCALTPLPNTQVYHTLKAQNRIFDWDWSKYDFEHIVYKPKKMSPEKLQDGFYSLKKGLQQYMYRQSIINMNQ